MNNRNLMHGLLTGFVVALVMVVPVSATTTVIDFEQTFSWSGQDIGYFYYADYGLTFTGANVVWIGDSNYNHINYPPHSTKSVFLSLSGNEIRIDFAAPVSRVGIWYTAESGGNIEAYSSSNSLIDSDSGGANLKSNSYIEVSGSNIAYVMLHGTMNRITYDDLEFDTDLAIPEFPNIAIPVLSIIGLVFLINRRMK